MISRNFCFFTGLFLIAGGVTAGDWAEWRGPARNGVAAQSPALPPWPAAGPVRIWKSLAIPSDKTGGFASPVIAGGKVFLYVNWKTQTPVPRRTLKEQALRSMGWIPEPVPETLRAAVETARVSEERLKLKDQPEELKAWLDAWVKRQVAEPDQAIFGRWASERLKRGPDAYPLAMLEALATIRNREFATPEELDAWFAEQKFSEEWKKKTVYWIPTTSDASADAVLCLDAATGALVWKYEVPGRVTDFGSSCTPCVVGKRCYAAGESTLFCLDTDSGALRWSVKTEAQEISASPLVLDGMVLLPAKALTAFDAETGAVRWQQAAVDGNKASPTLWRSGDKTYLICQGGKQLACVDPATGNTLWSIANTTLVTPVIVGNDLVTFGNESKTGLRAYTLTLTGASLRWSQPLADRSASPLLDGGYVYAIGGTPKTKLLCVELQSGTLRWEQPFGSSEYSSPVLADGKILTVKDNGRSLVLLRANPEKYEELASTNLPILRFTSPALSDGRIVLRLTDSLACYDPAAVPPPAAP